MIHYPDPPWDALGVGIGPFNLSVAALADSLPQLRLRFFEQRKEFQWHPGLLFPEATIQVSFLKDLVTLASGLAHMIPPCARPHLGDRVFHASQFLRKASHLAGQRVAVVGGGQTGAEIINHLLSRPDQRPCRIYWVTRRRNFLPLDES